MITKTPESIRITVHKTIAEVLEREQKDIKGEFRLVADLGASDGDIAEIFTYLEQKLHIIIPDRDEWTRKTRTVERLTKRVLACYRKAHGHSSLFYYHKKREDSSIGSSDFHLSPAV